MPVAGQGGGGGTITDGKFSIAREGGLVPGSYTVAIYAAATQGEQTKPKQVGGTRKESQVAKELIPAKYNANTELKAEIKKGGNKRSKFRARVEVNPGSRGQGLFQSRGSRSHHLSIFQSYRPSVVLEATYRLDS